MKLHSLRFFLTVGVLFAALGPNFMHAQDASKSAAADKPNRNARLQHVVSFKFKDGAPKDKVKDVEDAFRALKTKIPQIEKLQWGMNNSPEGLNKGFTHCWILTFRSAEDRDAYLKHPDHVAFGKMLGPVLGDVFVIDFWAKE